MIGSRALWLSIVLTLAGVTSAAAQTDGPAGVDRIVEAYLDRYFAMFPTRATAAGRDDHDEALEHLSAERREAWVAYVADTARGLRAALDAPGVDRDARLDAELLLAHLSREHHALAARNRPTRDPLYWSGLIANAIVLQLVRDDVAPAERFRRAWARARQLPRLAGEARDALASAAPADVAPELCTLAAGQLRAAARFYREGLTAAAPARDAALEAEAAQIAAAIEALAAFVTELGARATGSARLGDGYAENFRLGTGVDRPVETVLADMEADLEATRREAAVFGRSVWADLMAGAEPPADDRELLRRLFDRVAADRDTDVDTYIASWRTRARELDAFVRARDIMTLPDPFTLIIDRSPSFFIGQSVGGVYPAGPYSPDSKTLLYLPMPRDGASPEERDAFFRDFNRHFNTMIAPHELIPGHYVQLKIAARHPRKVRSLFPDPVYVEGWGTFCERLLLDLGWGGPLPRLAHLKKQLENIARAIVDIRVHTRGLSRDEVLRFVKEDALQDDQFASNMWVRALTSSPQITTYALGYREVRGAYDAAREAAGERFELKAFLDGMMAMGPVPVRHYRAQFEAAR